MVVLPPGQYMMGSPPSETYRGAEAQHSVTIPAPFAVSKFEITFDQWDACVTDGGCKAYRPNDEGWGRANRPVINVSWNDAKTYVAWLSRKTGKAYRLLSEAEWEYAARSGQTAAFAFGPALKPDQANFAGSTGDGAAPGDPSRSRTMPVGTFPPNAFGLHDMHGNVWEWVEDCWNDEYTAQSPSNGAPWLAGDCNGRVLRGGSWEDYQGDLRSAARVGGATTDQSTADGFRIARAL
jgi:formylglycine-generating enzyme required for sulfatase activity